MHLLDTRATPVSFILISLVVCRLSSLAMLQNPKISLDFIEGESFLEVDHQ